MRLLVPGARVGDVRPMGEGGRHARFSLSSGSSTAAGVAFGSNGALAAAQAEPSDLTVRLEVNQWKGAVEPRALLEGSRAGGEGPGASEGASTADCACGGSEADAAWWSRFDEELVVELAAEPEPPGPDPDGRSALSHGRRSAVALIGELLSSGGRVMIVGADARRRAKLATLAASPTRFGGSHSVICPSCPAEALEAAAGNAQLLLVDWEVLAAVPSRRPASPTLFWSTRRRARASPRLPQRTGPASCTRAWGGGRRAAGPLLGRALAASRGARRDLPGARRRTALRRRARRPALWRRPLPPVAGGCGALRTRAVSWGLPT